MKKFKLKVKGMHCNSCSSLIENQLKEKAGVTRCKISHETGKGVVVYDEDKISKPEITGTIEGAGDYQVTQEDDESFDDGESKHMKDLNQDGKSSKMMFIFGLVSGVAIFGIVGFFIFFGMYQGQDRNNLNNGSPVFTDDIDDSGGQQRPAQPSGGADIKVTEDDHIRGNFDAAVTIIEYSDYQCPFCSRFDDTMKQVMANYPNDVRWVYKHFPLDSIHPFARKAAEASECAGEQDKFWEYSDELFANQSSINFPYLKEAAKSIGLNTGKFDECLDSDKYASKVDDDYWEGISAGVSGTPGNIINGELVSGALPYEQMEAIIESILSK